MKTTIKKTFLDLTEEEDWLNQQGEKGLMLLRYRSGEYEFEEVSPVKFQYKIDIPNYCGSKKKDYLNFLEQSGISVVGEYGGRVYLRKNEADGPLELYTENKECSQQMKKRYIHFFTIGISQIGFGIFLLLQMLGYSKEDATPLWILGIFGTGLIISGIVFFVTGLRKQKKHVPEKEKVNLWE